MKKSDAMSCVDLTWEALERFWQLDIDFVLGLCCPDVMWIAPEQERYMRGIDAVRTDLAANREERVSCHLSSVEFDTVQNCGNACTVVGRYIVTTDDDAPYFISVQQRVLFTWELVDDMLRIRCMYISNPRGELAVADGESFVNALGAMASRYMEARLALAQDRRRISFYDPDGVLRFVPLTEVVCVQAMRKLCEIHTISANYQAKCSLRAIRAQLSEDFAEVHRSYSVNVNYVKSVRPYAVTMATGEEVPIPERRFASVRDELMRAHRP